MSRSFQEPQRPIMATLVIGDTVIILCASAMEHMESSFEFTVDIGQPGVITLEGAIQDHLKSLESQVTALIRANQTLRARLRLSDRLFMRHPTYAREVRAVIERTDVADTKYRIIAARHAARVEGGES